MYMNKHILAVVPARGGSKGVPLKNIRPVRGVPLVAMAGLVLTAVDEVDRSVCSTDHEDIARVAQEAGIDVPFMRPVDISGDWIGDWDVLHHALIECEKLDGVTYDIILLVQPTSPLRRPAHIRDCIHKLVDGGFDAVWCVTPDDPKHHPLKALEVGDDDGLNYYDPRGRQVIARQQLNQLYFRNGACYAISRQCLEQQKSTRGENCGAVVVDEPMVSIDTLWDFELVEYILEKRDA